MRRRRGDSDGEKRRYGAVIAWAIVTAIVCVVTVHLANRVTAASSEERALARAQPCATAGAGNRDCVEEVTGVAVGPPRKMYRSPDVKLDVAVGGRQTPTTLTSPHGVAPAFFRIQDGDAVELATWHGQIVSVTGQGDTERTPAAPAEQHRSRLTAAFFGAAFTVVLAGITLLSLVLTASFCDADARRRPGIAAASTVIFAGFATAFSTIAIMTGASLTTAIVAALVIVGVGVAGAAGTWLWRRLRRDREAFGFLRTGPGS